MGDERAIIFYDADCRFCMRMLNIIMRWDEANGSHLKPVALQSIQAGEALAPMSAEEQLSSWHLRYASGKVVSAGAAAPHLLELIGRFSFVARLMRRFPATNERLYAWVAAHRSLMGRLTKRLPEYEG